MSRSALGPLSQGSQGQTLGGKKRSNVVNPLYMLYIVSDMIRAMKQKYRLGNTAFIAYEEQK